MAMSWLLTQRLCADLAIARPMCDRNLAKSQDRDVTLELHSLPVLEHMDVIDASLGSMFQLVEGRSAETSGGLMVILPADEAEVRLVVACVECVGDTDALTCGVCWCMCACVCLHAGVSQQAFITAFKELDGNDAWVIGRVLDGEGAKSARIVDEPTIISV